MSIWQIKIRKSFSGRSNRQRWSNLYHVESAITEISAPVLRQTIDAIVAAERSAHLDEVFFLDAFMRQRADNTFNAPANAFVRRILDGTGDREAVTPPLPLEIALAVSREAENGRAGTMLYRGCLMQSDVETGEDNSYRLTSPAPFTTGGIGADTVIEKLNGDLPGGTFCMVNAAGLAVQTAREVILHRVAGVVIVKANRNRRSVESDEISTAQRQINSYNTRLNRLYKRAGAGGLVGELLAAAVDLALAAFNVYMALPVGPRAALKIAPRLLALMPGR
jgi:hypothetical protein